MRNTAKITTAVLAAGALTLGLSACGSDKDSASDTSGPLVVAATPDPARRDPHLRQGQPGEEGGPRPGGQGVHRLRHAEHGDRGRLGGRQLLPEPAVPRRLQQEERHPHRARRPRCTWSRSACTPTRSRSAGDLKSGATIALPNDTVNEARALKLLAANGLITLKDGAGNSATPPGHRQEPEEPRVQGAGGGPDPALPGRRRRRGHQRQLRPRGRPQARPRTPSSWSPPRTTRTATSSPSRRATRTTRA